MNLVTQINGVPIYSDKGISSIVNTRVTFTDGSWCDVATGDVVNRGPGSISLGTPGASSSQQHKTLGPNSYMATAVDVRGVLASLEVSVHDALSCEVTITGPESLVEGISVKEQDGILVIEGSGGSNGGVTIVSGGGGTVRVGGRITGSLISGVNRGTIISGGDIVSISGGASRGSPLAQISVKVPQGTTVEVSGVEGNTRIGDTHGNVRLRASGTEPVTIGRIGKLNARVSGTSSVNVTKVSGNTDIKVSGTGRVTIEYGEIDELSISLSGVADVDFKGTAQDADIDVSGVGNVFVQRVVNRPRKSVSGMGRITIGNW